MTTALTVLGWLIMLLGISASIALHEIGHLVPAKRSGVKVTQYMVGFGPTLWSRRRGETEYGIKAIPLGGYIRMIGMLPPQDPNRPLALRGTTTGRLAAIVEDARQAAQDEIEPQDADRVFYKIPVRRKLLVMLGGPTMNLVLAAVLFTIALCVVGTPERTNVVGAVAPCVLTEAQWRASAEPTTCPGAQAPSVRAGLKAGDRIVSFGGVPTPDWPSVREQIQQAPVGEPVTLRVLRDGQEVVLTARLVNAPRPTFDDQGELVGFTKSPFLGFIPQEQLIAQPLSAVPTTMGQITVGSVKAIITLPARMVDLGRTVFADQPRDPNGLVGVVGVGRISGEVVSAEGVEAGLKVLEVLTLLAGLNLFLFLFNLIPLLPLDGGYVAGALWEGTKRGWARARHRPDPGPVDVAKGLPLAYAISAVLIAMGALLVYADIVKPITFGQ